MSVAFADESSTNHYMESETLIIYLSFATAEKHNEKSYELFCASDHPSASLVVSQVLHGAVLRLAIQAVRFDSLQSLLLRIFFTLHGCNTLLLHCFES